MRDFPGRGGFYQVQIGSFKERQEAASAVKKVSAEGFPAMVDTRNQMYRVLVGRYQELDNAVLMEKMLRRHGYVTKIVG